MVSSTLNFNNQPLLIGGLNSPDPVLERPGQVHTDDFVGCLQGVSINGRALNLSRPLQAEGVVNKCVRSLNCAKSAAAIDSCAGNSTKAITKVFLLVFILFLYFYCDRFWTMHRPLDTLFVYLRNRPSSAQLSKRVGIH